MFVLVPGASATAPARDASHPVVLPCPQCGAPLHITSDSARTLPCEYCKTDVYLPDDLWRRLHPMKVMAPWFVRFEGASRADLERAAGERARLENDARRASADAVQHQLSLDIIARNIARRKKIATRITLIASPALLVGLCLLAYSIPFLAHDAHGSRFADSPGFGAFFVGLPLTLAGGIALLQAISLFRMKQD